MTLVSEIIRDAYRECNLIAISADPTTAEQAEGLRLLNRFVASVYGQEFGEELLPVLIGRNNINRPSGFPWYENVPDTVNWFVPSNSRVVLNLTTPQTLYLNPNPHDGERFAFIDKSSNLSTYPITINANGRSIAGTTSVTYSTDGDVREFMYRADIGDWTQVLPLEADDTFPFPTAFDDLFVIGLALRINPRNAQETVPDSTGMFNRLMRQFKARYRQKQMQPAELALVLTPGERRRFYDSNYANSIFNAGVVPYWWYYP